MGKAEFLISQSVRTDLPFGMREILRIGDRNTKILYGNLELIVASNEYATMALIGEVYNDLGERIDAEKILHKYTCQELNLKHYIDGSFIMVFLCKTSDKLEIWTDPVNSRKVFSGPDKKHGRFYSTSILSRPENNISLDFAAIGSYLANGVMYYLKTPFNDVRILPAATRLTDSDGSVKQMSYWKYEITNSYEARNEKDLLAEMKEHIKRSIDIRSWGRKHIIVSISGGYDSAGIAGILKELGHSPVSCFSYIYGEAKKDSDAFIAGQMAEMLGYEHKLVQSYNGNLLATILENARAGEGMANFCDEIDIWEELDKHITKLGNPILFAGDMYYLPNVQPQTVEDCISAISMNPSSILIPYKRYSNQGIIESIVRNYDASYQQTIDAIPAYQNLKDLKDHLYITHRIPHTLMMWREMIQMRHLPVVNPLLDRKLLNFVASLPTELRDGKSLYIRAMKELCPQLFTLQRAKENRVKPDWAAEFSNFRSEIEEWILNTESPLDDIFPPDKLVTLLEDHEGSSFSLTDFLGRAGRSIRYRYPITNKFISKYIPLPPKVIGSTVMLKRILVMRSFLTHA